MAKLRGDMNERPDQELYAVVNPKTQSMFSYVAEPPLLTVRSMRNFGKKGGGIGVNNTRRATHVILRSTDLTRSNCRSVYADISRSGPRNTNPGPVWTPRVGGTKQHKILTASRPSGGECLALRSFLLCECGDTAGSRQKEKTHTWGKRIEFLLFSILFGFS